MRKGLYKPKNKHRQYRYLNTIFDYLFICFYVIFAYLLNKYTSIILLFLYSIIFIIYKSQILIINIIYNLLQNS